MYALFDWDYTLRDGFTVFDFADCLTRRGILAPSALDEMTRLRKEYELGALTHDELAERVPGLFASGLSGRTSEEVRAALEDYLDAHDRGVMYSFTPVVFDFCRRRGIDTIIVSGAPAMVVRRYEGELGIGEINAFDCEVEDGVHTGRVAVNNGFDKAAAVRRIMEERREEPIFAMGDSASDAALLAAAKLRLSVGRNWEWVPDRSNHYICDADGDGREIIRFLERRI